MYYIFIFQKLKIKKLDKICSNAFLKMKMKSIFLDSRNKKEEC